MHEELTRGEWSLLRVALRLHIYEYNHEDEHLRELNSVYNKLVGMELTYERDEKPIPPTPHAPNWRYTCPHCGKSWEMAERCEDFRQVCSDCVFVLIGGE
jgi:predicted  nucleic acid-binding Zn ribbon protein